MSATQPGVKPTSDTTASGAPLVERLNRLVRDQNLGALALLRRGLGRQPGETPEVCAQVLPYLALPKTFGPAQRERVEDAALLVASLYALWHQGKAAPRSARGVSLGGAFRALASQSDSGGIERRFVALLKASRERLPDHLRHAIALLKAKEIALDWELLLRHLAQWDETNRRAQHPVRRQWARDYWEGARPTGDATTEEGVEESSEEGSEGDA